MFLKRAMTNFKIRLDYYGKSQAMLIEAATEIENEIDAAGGPAAMRSFAVAPEDMQKSLKQLIAEEEERNMQLGLIETDDHTQTEATDHRMLTRTGGLW